ncbi:MAG: hypothetical protein N3A67_09920, partial [Ignavibacteria bacterium]|nr:hypothetical protein [Ignavibacteria bacterium]
PTIKSFSNGQLISTKKLDKFTLMRSTTEEIINSLYANYIKDKNPTPLTLSLMQTAQNEIKITLTAYTRWSFDLPRSNGVSNKPKSKDYYIGGTGLHQYYDNVNKYNLFLNSLGISKQNVNYLWKKKYYDIPFMTRYHAYITNTNVFKTFENKFLDDRIDYEETQKNYAAKT